MGMVRQTKKAAMIALSFGFFSARSRVRLIHLYNNQSRTNPNASRASPITTGLSHPGIQPRPAS